MAYSTPPHGTPVPLELVKPAAESSVSRISGQSLDQSNPAGLNIIGAEDLFGPLAPVQWLCQTLLIAPGAPTMFAGYGYSGKSVALQSLALSVASGSILWGQFGARRGRVLHLDYEQGRRITSERYQRLAYAARVDPRTLYGTLEVGVLPSVGLIPELLLRISDGRTLIVVDSWRAAHPGIDENSSDVRKTLDAMGVASEKTGCCFVVLHHTRKPQKDASGGLKMAIRGSSGFFDGCQTTYVFDGEKVGRPLVTLEKDRISGQSPDPFTLVISDTDEGQGLLVRHEDVPVAREKEPAEKFLETMELLSRLIAGRPGMSGSEMAEITGKRKSHVLAAVESLANSGEIVKEGNGPSTRYYSKGMVRNAPF